jgi:hypothetical protein
MPKKKIYAVFFLGLLVLACLLVPYLYVHKLSVPASAAKPSFFATVPITSFTPTEIPCVTIEVGGKRFLTLLDLGYSRFVSLQSEMVHKIPDKNFLKTRSIWGVRGERQEQKQYLVPSLQMGDLTIAPVVVEEESALLHEQAQIVKGDTGFTLDGKIGWRLFKNMALFLDLDEDQIMVCDSIETFKKYGPSLKDFVKVPLLLEQELIEFDLTTPKGPLRCFLDSGCTSNHLQCQNPHNRPLSELYFENRVEFPYFQIGSKKFQSITFHAIPLPLPVRVQGVLGMDFLFNTQVFIDFKNRYIYFKERS